MDIIYKKKFFRPITISKYGLLLYKNNKLFLMNTQTNDINFFCKIKLEGYRGKLSKTRFLTRIFHRYVFCGITPKNSDYSFIAFNDSVYKVDYNKKTVELSLKFECEDMHRPLSFFEIKGVDGFADSIVFGEYSYNRNRNKMSIFQYSNESWKKVFTFPKNSIKHIHSIIPDPYHNRVLILTGDLDCESMVLEAKDNFHIVRCLLQGEQKYRFCCAKSFDFGTILITDSPFDQNNVYLLHDEPNIFLEKLYSIPGPTVFFANHGSDIIFATDVEDDEKNLSPLLRFFYNRRGAGVLDCFTHVYVFNKEKRLIELARFKKDRLPMRLFGFGTVHIPDGNSSNKLFLYPMAVKKYDQVLLCIDLRDYYENC